MHPNAENKQFRAILNAENPEQHFVKIHEQHHGTQGRHFISDLKQLYKTAYLIHYAT
jgi:hypothetical protein